MVGGRRGLRRSRRGALFAFRRLYVGEGIAVTGIKAENGPCPVADGSPIELRDSFVRFGQQAFDAPLDTFAGHY